MALGGTSYLYDKLYGRQTASETHEPVELDTSGEPLQPNNRYWVVSNGDEEVLVYNDLIDIDNYLENFSDSGHDSYRSAVLSLYGYCPEVKLIRYLGNHSFEEEK